MTRRRKRPKVYYDFKGGVNVDSALDSVADNELIKGDNVDLMIEGPIVKRKGTAPFNALSYNKTVERLFEFPRNNGDVILMAIMSDNKLYKIAEDGTSTHVADLNGLDIGTFNLQDKLHFVDGSAYRTYDGTTVANVVQASGADLAPIRKCTMACRHTKSARLFTAGNPDDKACLYYSEYNEPGNFKAVSKLYPSTADGPVTAISTFGEALVVFYQNSAWAWKGINPAVDMSWEKLPTERGVVARRSLDLTPNSMTFLGMGGLFSFSPGLLDYSIVLLTGNELVNNRTENKVNKWVRTMVHPSTACGVFDLINNRYMLAYGDDAGNPKNNKIMILDWRLQAFTRYTGIGANDICQRRNGDMLIASKNYILKLGVGDNDFDVETGQYKPIDFDVEFKPFDLGHPFVIKKNSLLLVASRQYWLEVSSVVLSIACDYRVLEVGEIDLDESLVWGEVWGGLWGWTDHITTEIRCRLKGQRFSVKMRNNKIDQPVTIYGLCFVNKPIKPRGTRHIPQTT